MIAIASGLLGTVETATATVAKKDAGSSGFAAAFEQVSASEAGTAAKGGTQAPGARGRRAVAGDSKTPDQAGVVKRVSGSSGAVILKVPVGDAGTDSAVAVPNRTEEPQVKSGALPASATAATDTVGLAKAPVVKPEVTDFIEAEATTAGGPVTTKPDLSATAPVDAESAVSGQTASLTATSIATEKKASTDSAPKVGLQASTESAAVPLSINTVQPVVADVAFDSEQLARQDTGTSQTTNISPVVAGVPLAPVAVGALIVPSVPAAPYPVPAVPVGLVLPATAPATSVAGDTASAATGPAALVAPRSAPAAALPDDAPPLATVAASVPLNTFPVAAVSAASSPTRSAAVATQPVTAQPIAAQPVAAVSASSELASDSRGDGGLQGATAQGAIVGGGDGVATKPVTFATGRSPGAPPAAASAVLFTGQTARPARSVPTVSAPRAQDDGGGDQAVTVQPSLQEPVAVAQGQPVETLPTAAVVGLVAPQLAPEPLSAAVVVSSPLPAATQQVPALGGSAAGQQAGSIVGGAVVPARHLGKRVDLDAVKSVEGGSAPAADAGTNLVASAPASSADIDPALASIAANSSVTPAPVAAGVSEPVAQPASVIPLDFAPPSASTSAPVSSPPLEASVSAAAVVAAQVSPLPVAIKTPATVAARIDGVGMATGANTIAAVSEPAVPTVVQPHTATTALHGSGTVIASSGDIGETSISQAGASAGSNDELTIPVVAAANFPVAATQAGRALVGGASAGRERKISDAEEKVAAPRSGEAASAAAPVSSQHAAVAAQDTAKPVAIQTQAPAESGNQTQTTGTAGLVAGIGTAPVSALQATPHVVVAPTTAPTTAGDGVAQTSILTGSGIGLSSSGMVGADSLVSPMAHTTLQATPTVLEVGVPGGTHGWLKIRAEIGEGGTVQASMSAATHEGQETLRRELPAMNAFLDSEHVPVSVQVAAHGLSSSGGNSVAEGSLLGGDTGFNLGSGLSQDPGSARSEAGTGSLAGGDSARQGGGEGAQDSHRQATSGTPESARGVVSGESEWVSSSNANSGSGYGSGISVNGGSWLNVMA